MLQIRRKRLYKLAMRCIVGLSFLTVVTYPIIIKPMLDPSEYKEMQRIGREGMVQEKIQPGNMKVWSDPFKSSK